MSAQKFYLFKKEEVDKVLAMAPEIGKRMLFKSSDNPVGILEDKDVVNDAEVHKTEGDLWLCLEGEVTFICGGELVDPWFSKDKDGKDKLNELKAKEIKGGTEMTLKPGDWLWIPAGEPHQHKCSGLSRLVIIKIPKHGR